MMKAACIWQRKLVKVPYKLVNWVHDEWQSQVLDTDDYPNIVAREQMAALLEAGQELRMNISTPGSPHIGYNWSETH